MQFIGDLYQKFLLFIGNFSVAPSYIQAGAIVVLIFLLILTLAQVRSHFVHWSMKGGLVGLFFGIMLTLILEGFLLVSGHTAITGVLGWKNAPKPFSTALDLGKSKLINVLDVNSNDPTTNDAINIIQSLDPSEITKIKAIMCTQ